MRLDLLKRTAKANGLSLHKSSHKTINGTKVVRKVFFYPAGFKDSSRSRATIVRFGRDAEGMFRLSLRKGSSVETVLEAWEKMRPASIQATTKRGARPAVPLISATSMQATTKRGARPAVPLISGTSMQETTTLLEDMVAHNDDNGEFMLWCLRAIITRLDLTVGV